MPNLPTANGFPRTEKCFESRHLSSSDFKVYHVVLACAIAYRKARNDNGPLIFQYSVRPWLCNAVPTSENNARKILERLEEQGWLVAIEKDRRGPNGKALPNIYQVLTHDEFLRTHPGSCPSNDFGPGTRLTSLVLSSPCPQMRARQNRPHNRVPCPQLRARTVPTIGVLPSPQMERNRPHNCGQSL